MADVYLVCRDARADTLITNVALGLQLKAGGSDVAVLFTGESLCAFAGEAWHWPPHLAGRPAQVSIARGAADAGLDLNADFDRRWLDLEKLIQQALALASSLSPARFGRASLGLATRFHRILPAPGCRSCSAISVRRSRSLEGSSDGHLE